MAFINRNYGKIIKKITRKDKNGYYEWQLKRNNLSR
jgi:hypothetical protein